MLIVRLGQFFFDEAAKDMTQPGQFLQLDAVSNAQPSEDDTLTIAKPMARMYSRGIADISSISSRAVRHASSKVVSLAVKDSIRRSLPH
jgi:hypothetical protein